MAASTMVAKPVYAPTCDDCFTYPELYHHFAKFKAAGTNGASDFAPGIEKKVQTGSGP
jgi:hypothetical protein